ncbi:DUF3077 domain-containing protein [Pseudomonas gingeri]|uniref:DUF3077 domain-containing protein n=1 Tax=Pseudomonas gingeri TaxID=117681 RepID=A0A7Y7XJK2_9PSED|nr:DUF3077 domain-containing protein [Pseudomonas gingeri]NWA27998.1 DUF3077 domain-containing protein [Pseudomonas gingeri]NWC00003.1 DUF3077 domain-containing protein [Pseudomonas gingeri]NWD70071.1 DUF3077 domain-containing protein [Pseudomonas gingeri]NWD74056.1 DUF3077 domain-containing protein [Pseudomonas gingeri]
MTSITTESPRTDSKSPLTSLKDRAAAQRALDYYLKPGISTSTCAANTSDDAHPHKLFAVRDDLNIEDAMIQASDLLRCAAAAAYEAANGGNRDLGGSVVYMIDMAKALVDRVVQIQNSTP